MILRSWARIGNRQSRRGFLLLVVIAIGLVLLTLGVTLHQSSVRQNTSLHNLSSAEIAHFLAEAGINASVRSIREALQKAEVSGNAPPPAVWKLLTQPQPLPDTSLMSHLQDTWNKDLEFFAAEVDPTAEIRVEVWLRGFQQTETDPTAWVDPVAKTGYLTIESTGKYRGMKRTLSIKRRISVAGILPPVVSKFTLHLKDAARGQEGRFNVIRNDYNGNLTDGPRPFICLNQATPDSPLEPTPYDPTKGVDPQVYLSRGWVWLGGSKVRLHLTSGPGRFGEIFHFYEVKDPSSFQAVRFVTPTEKLPPVFSSPQNLPRDNNPPGQMTTYSFGHSFLLEGFHDKSNRREHDAMYEGSILSNAEKAAFGAKSSLLHLYGEGSSGLISRTKVFGNVQAAFPQFAQLDISTTDSTLDGQFKALTPPPTYLLPSLPGSIFNPNRELKDFLGRRFGGPILLLRLLFGSTTTEYQPYMSRIVEMPYNTGYNAIQDYLTNSIPRRFPPRSSLLHEDSGQSLELKRGDLVLYKGSVDAPRLAAVLQGRVQLELESVSEFWKRFYDPSTGALRLNMVVRIRNPDKSDLIIPPPDKPGSLLVEGGGLVLLDQGNLLLRGIRVANAQEALTIFAPQAMTVRCVGQAPQQVNVVAPLAEFSAAEKLEFYGTLCAGTIAADERCPGGFFRYREQQDPTRGESQSFCKIFIDEQDTSWHE